MDETPTPSGDETLIPPPGGSGPLSQGDPTQIGRYRILRLLGRGGFGRVYLGQDDELHRPVAIKVPIPERVSRPEDVEAYLNEARMLARMDHPHIVRVYDVGRTDDGLCFVVSKFIEGSDLAARIRSGRFTFPESARLIATLAEALHHAHTRGLVHRDIKPANILIDAAGTPWVADFGLALKAEDLGKGADLAGTPAYMSPEQARREGHRVDGRSDVFSLGAVFYELLTGRRPFSADSTVELLDLIAKTDVRPPRQIDDTIPRELERICLHALARRASDRYTTARDLADDLRHFLAHASEPAPRPTPPAVVSPAPGSTRDMTPPPVTPQAPDSDQHVVRIVPKGLRSFDEHDADFFLDLLPGARDREGLPDGIRFWKSRIEILDPDKAFRVGLIYGPSGCGKSSLMKAGLLPRLAKHVFTVYIEATPDETENRLLEGIRKACSDLPRGLGLVDSLTQARRGRVLPARHKVLLVLDQFEQWLHARRAEENTELVAALRQCDGEHLQAVVLVRDDFWLAASRFMRDLEIRLLEGENSALVDLFDPRHARKVLTAFGVAYQTLPEPASEIAPEQHAFIDQAVADLSQDGKVISVRLALFAELVKGKPWTPGTLREVGGTEGVGVTFLEETFSASTAPPEHRLHQRAARAVLSALLPETGSDIKGRMRSEAELRTASGYADRPRDHADLIHILDRELRLVTPTDPEGGEDDPPAATPGGRYYQLTHDYLVPSLRDWLTRKKRETRRGRAELKLAERSASWNARPENRLLPSLLEWANIRLLTRKRDWSDAQRAMMKRAAWVHGRRSLAAMILIGVLTWGGIETHGNLRASGLVEKLTAAGTADVPRIVEELEGFRRWVNPRLVPLASGPNGSSREKLHASLALLSGGDASQVPYLEQRLLAADSTQLPVLRDVLKPHRAGLVPRLWAAVESAGEGDASLLPAASALADYDPASARWEASSTRLARALVNLNPVFLGPWIDLLRPARGALAPPLAVVFRDKTRPETERTLATNILADYLRDDPERAAELLLDAEPRAFAALFPLVERRPTKGALEGLDRLAATLPPEDLGSVARVPFGQRRANAAVTLLRLGRLEEGLRVFDWADDPEALTQFVFRCRDCEVGADALLDCLRLVGDAPRDRYPRDSRHALLLALGEFALEKIPQARRPALLKQLADWYRADPSSGVHGASGWLLRRWGQADAVRQVDQTPVPYTPDREWFTLAITVKPTQPSDPGEAAPAPARPSPTRTFHYTFVVFPAGEYRNGSVEDEPNRIRDEVRHVVKLTRPFALLDREITFEELIAFAPKYSGFMRQYDAKPVDAGFGAHWYDAVAFSRWLGEQLGLPEMDQPYPDPATLDKERYPREPNPEASWAPRDWPVNLDRRGFRLPTEAEWEVACRGGARTAFAHGGDIALLGRFCWFVDNSGGHVHPPQELRPSPRGVFDLHGNLFEWTHDWYDEYDTPTPTDPLGAARGSDRVLRGGGWGYTVAICRVASRYTGAPTHRATNRGFRLALRPSGGEPEAGEGK